MYIHICTHTYINTYIHMYIHICLILYQCSLCLAVYRCGYDSGCICPHLPSWLIRNSKLCSCCFRHLPHHTSDTTVSLWHLVSIMPPLYVWSCVVDFSRHLKKLKLSWRMRYYIGHETLTSLEQMNKLNYKTTNFKLYLQRCSQAPSCPVMTRSAVLLAEPMTCTQFSYLLYGLLVTGHFLFLENCHRVQWRL